MRRHDTFGEIIAARLDRRQTLKGLAAACAAALPWPAWVRAARAAGPSSLTFRELDRVLDRDQHVAPGYRAQVLLRWGDAIAAGVGAFDPTRLSAPEQERRFGYNNDFIAYMPLVKGSNASTRGLLCVNHESSGAALMWPGFRGSRDARRRVTPAQMATEMAAQGMSVVEIRRDGPAGNWRVMRASRYNRRFSARTKGFRLTGPAAGNERLRTRADPTGRSVTGTFGNCAGGVTPWGTVLSGEENFDGYFVGDESGSREAGNHRRYGVGGGGWYGWHRIDDRFDVAKEPNEANRFGWVVEIDPYDPTAAPLKRTALGRLKHEAATTAVGSDGRVAVYTGDDERFQHLYRYVSREAYRPGAGAGNRDLLDRGVLSVARFHADGRLTWLPLVHGHGPLTKANGFDGQADVLIETRRAARLMGATKMDRPEDVETNPATGHVYVALTNNSRRRPDQTDAANPRGPNIFGHILELIPPGDGPSREHGADEFRWKIFISAGDPRDPSHKARYPAEPSAAGWLISPDNFAFDPRGRLWIATDRGGLQRITRMADGLYGCDTTGPARGLTRLFYACPRGAEVTGPAFTPDGTTLFVAVQHPGGGSTYDNPSTRWPDFRPNLPPRPSVVALSREGGGEIGG